jgi:hypothetical protein
MNVRRERGDEPEAPGIVDLREELAERRGLTWRERLGGTDRYGALLLLIVLTIVASVVLRSNEAEQLVAITLVGLMLIFALHTSQAPRSLRLAALAVAPALVVATAVAEATSEASEIRAGIATAVTLLLLIVLAAIVRRLGTHLTISWSTILGALCIYLLFGMVFASAYSVAGHLQDEELFVQQQGFDTVDTMYFSLITLTTVGYGDLTMRSDVTRIMAANEALFGQIYLVTMVALLVGNLGRQRRTRRRADDT